MDDPELSTLCSICHIDPPKYTCPRDLVETCSLACSKRHKIWSSCNGVRDPTVFVPKSQLHTPSGIDHDYNFLHSIEHKIERSEKAIIEDHRLVKRAELKRAREGREHRPRPDQELPGEACVKRVLQSYRIRVHKAPKGMRRNKENTTSWSRRRGAIVWQVEWFREGATRLLHKNFSDCPLKDVYKNLIEEERKLNLTDEERATEKKRKAVENKERHAKRARIEQDTELDMTAVSRLQDSQTSAWGLTQAMIGQMEDDLAAPAYFYLHRPNTPSSFPKVLVPLDASKPLLEQLRKRELLEFPTIYVQETDSLPEKCMLEKDYLEATGLPGVEEEDSSSSEEESDTSTSGSDSSSDEELEDGEIR
ncbi:putative box C/D snoRNA protein [Lachnellula suecica]|uniref:Box C/D snoRNA protein 1 n=1 Tax=Lachnellula suecica TaxID=602035 RepID=A0A8T9CEL1_9HELO|nr:putative box C/D snoRNA protein [Lachnellula suecica]